MSVINGKRYSTTKFKGFKIAVIYAFYGRHRSYGILYTDETQNKLIRHAINSKQETKDFDINYLAFIKSESMDISNNYMNQYLK